MVYLDSVFALNAAIDYALCLLTARLSGIPLRRRRYLLAALLGGLYGATVFLPGLVWLSSPPVQTAVWLLMTLLAYGGEERWLRLTLLFALLSCLLAGAVLGLGMALRVSGGGLLAVAAAALCLTLWLVFRASVQNGVQGKRLLFRLRVGGSIMSGTALWDTGNQLRDPVRGQPVLVLAPEKARQFLPPALRGVSFQDPAELLKLLQAHVPEWKPRLLPYRAVGRPSGLLVTVQAEWVELQGSRTGAVRVALSPTPLGEGCDALWGGGTHQGGNKYGLFESAFAAGEGGSCSAHPLHWRQRHAPAAADEGAGGSLAGAARGAGGPTGADRA